MSAAAFAAVGAAVRSMVGLLREAGQGTRGAAAEPTTAQRRERERERLLDDVATLTDAVFSHAAALDRIARLPLPLLADWVVVYEPGSTGVPQRVAVAARDRASEEALEHALETLPRQLSGHDPLAAVGDVLRNGEPVSFHDVVVSGFTMTGRNSSERLLLERLQPHSLRIVPLRSNGRLLGAMVFARAGAAAAEAPEDAPVAEYCRRAARLIDSASRFDAAIAERASAEAARSRLLGIVDNLSSGYIALDGAGRVAHMNRAAELITARSRQELLGRNLWQALPPNTRDAPVARFVTDACQRNNRVMAQFNVPWTGHGRWLEMHVEPSLDGVALYLRDVTERRAMEERLRVQEEALRHSQKLEAVGRLAGRLAHDFNNMLMSIAGCAELLGRKIGSSEDAQEDIREILRSTQRATSLTRQLLTYSRKQVHQPRLIDLGSAISEMQRRLHNVLREDIVLIVNVADADTPVHADPNQIEQMLLNFAMNARDAMPDGGTLTIRIAHHELLAGSSRLHDGLEPGAYISLEVSDTGTGIDAALLPHIFEPFFTTKAAHKGTGLGLASVYGIVRQNHGSISVHSTVGRGTTFQVLFPAATGAVQEAITAALAAEPPAAALFTEEEPLAAWHAAAPLPFPQQPPAATPASGVILVAEDEHTVRRFVCEVLRQRGYTVLEARTGVEGLAVARRHGGPIDLLLTDVVMPEMGGRDLAQRIAELAPATRILFMSGYAENEIAHHGVLASGVELLDKPFSATVLLERVRAVLDGSEPPDARGASRKRRRGRRSGAPRGAESRRCA